MSGGASGIDVLQGVLVHSVTVTGDDLLVDIYGSAQNICGSVRFTFPATRRRRAMTGLLQRWAREGTPVTFVQSGSTIALQNDKALYGDQLESTA